MECGGQDVELEGTVIRRDRTGRMKLRGRWNCRGRKCGDEIGTKFEGSKFQMGKATWEERKSGIEGAVGDG